VREWSLSKRDGVRVNCGSGTSSESVKQTGNNGKYVRNSIIVT